MTQAQAAGVLQAGALELFFVFVAPGLVALMVYDLLVPTERRDFGASFIQVVTFSGINIILWSWSPLVVNPGRLAVERPWWSYPLAIVALLVSPAFLAWAWYRLRNAKFMQGRVSSTAPSGWDAFFGRGESCLVLFHLKNGEKIGGLFADRSDASTFPNPQQVYGEELWKLDEEYNLVERIPRSMGGIINKEDCDYVEFFTLGDEPGDGGEREDDGQEDGRIQGGT